MTSKRFLLRSAVYLILIKDDRVLLLRRFNTGWQDGNYSLVAGHLDGDETVKDTMIRETKEEIGIIIKKEDLKIVHIIHRKTLNDNEYIDFFLTTNKWTAEPKNIESDKCDEIKWLPLKMLPDNLLPHVKQALENYEKNIPFSEFGFDGEVEIY